MNRPTAYRKIIVLLIVFRTLIVYPYKVVEYPNYGMSVVALIKDRDTGNSKGFAFVEVNTQVEAERAITMLNGFHLEDGELKVNLAKPREDRSSGFSRQRR